MMTLYDMFEYMNPTLKDKSYSGYLIFCHLKYKNKFEVYKDLFDETFQKGGSCVTAEYTILDSGNVSV